MNINPQNITHLGKNHYTPNVRTKSIYYCKNNVGLDYILQYQIYKKSSPQFVLSVRDIFMQSYASKLIKQTNYVQTDSLTGA